MPSDSTPQLIAPPADAATPAAAAATSQTARPDHISQIAGRISDHPPGQVVQLQAHVGVEQVLVALAAAPG